MDIFQQERDALERDNWLAATGRTFDTPGPRDDEDEEDDDDEDEE